MPVQPSLFDPPSGHAPSTTTLNAARLCSLVQELILLNEQLPVIVEGARDVQALRRLGLNGTIVQLHCGQTVAAVGERTSRAFPAVIVLLDWDRRGRQLHKQLTRHLDCDWEAHNYIRHELMALCKSSISTVEELPAFLAAQGGDRLPPPPAL
jgi:5S rRNA maturation endonuclease (ribonuclease M5)